MKQIELRTKLYYVSSDGRVYDHKMNELPLREHKKYLYFKGKLVHRLVAKLYSDEYFENCSVHHINEITHDNRICNLKVMITSEHVLLHKVKHTHI